MLKLGELCTFTSLLWTIPHTTQSKHVAISNIGIGRLSGKTRQMEQWDYLGLKILSDFIMVIGKIPAGHVGQRASGIGAMYANAVFDYHWPSIAKKITKNLLNAITKMQIEWVQKYKPLVEELRPMSIIFYQDDRILIFMSKILAELYDGILFPSVEKVLEIPISPKTKT